MFCDIRITVYRFTSTNDDIENLADVLAVKGVTVYAIDTDANYNEIYAYKINRTDCYFGVVKEFKENVRNETWEEIRKYKKC